VYTVNTRRSVEQAVRLGVSGLVTNWPARVRRWLAEMNPPG
jgi:glycerophosphoryl diester phosphodiesterase